MILEKKREALKEAANEIMENGDTFTLHKRFDKVNIDLIDKDWAKKIYETRALLRRYENKHTPLFVGVSIILFFLLLFLYALISTNYFYEKFGVDVSLFDNGFMYWGLFILYIYFLIKLSGLMRKVYLNLKWKTINDELKMIKMESSFLQNQFGASKEFSSLVSIIVDKLTDEEYKRYRNYQV